MIDEADKSSEEEKQTITETVEDNQKFCENISSVQKEEQPAHQNENKPSMENRGRSKHSALTSTRTLSKDRFSSKENTNFSKENVNDISEEKFIFKAKPMPEFTLKELKRSSSNLTIPNPPRITPFKKSTDNISKNKF